MFNPSNTILSGQPRATLQQWLTEAHNRLCAAGDRRKARFCFV